MQSSLRIMNYQKQLQEIKNDFIKSKNLQNKQEKVKILRRITDKCNIFEDINVDYLKALKETLKDDMKFKEELLKFEPSISEKTLNENFPSEINKIKPNEKFKYLFEEIIEISTNLEKKEDLLDSLTNLLYTFKETNFFEINFQLLQQDNLELYLNKMYELLFKNIISDLSLLKIGNITNYSEESKKIYEAIEKSLQEKKADLDLDDSNENLIKELKILIQKKNAFQILQNNYASNFFENFSIFFIGVYDNFSKRFPNFEIKNVEFEDFVI